jgi:hypothetical protein
MQKLSNVQKLYLIKNAGIGSTLKGLFSRGDDAAEGVSSALGMGKEPGKMKKMLNWMADNKKKTIGGAGALATGAAIPTGMSMMGDDGMMEALQNIDWSDPAVIAALTGAGAAGAGGLAYGLSGDDEEQDSLESMA